jgi:hypothetical protein
VIFFDKEESPDEMFAKLQHVITDAREEAVRSSRSLQNERPGIGGVQGNSQRSESHS